MADLGLNRLAAYCRDKVSGRGNAKCILWHTATAAIKRTASKRWVGHVNVGRPGVLAAIGIEMRRQMPALGPLRPASAPSRTAARPLSALPGGRGIASGDSPVAFACIIFASSIRQLQSRAAVIDTPRCAECTRASRETFAHCPVIPPHPPSDPTLNRVPHLGIFRPVDTTRP